MGANRQQLSLAIFASLLIHAVFVLAWVINKAPEQRPSPSRVLSLVPKPNPTSEKPRQQTPENAQPTTSPLLRKPVASKSKQNDSIAVKKVVKPLYIPEFRDLSPNPEQADDAAEDAIQGTVFSSKRRQWLAAQMALPVPRSSRNEHFSYTLPGGQTLLKSGDHCFEKVETLGVGNRLQTSYVMLDCKQVIR